jgi:hypothetical protein
MVPLAHLEINSGSLLLLARRDLDLDQGRSAPRPGTPITAKLLLGKHFVWPVDGGLRLFDRRKLLGAAKPGADLSGRGC